MNEAALFRDPAKKSLGQHFLHERGIVEKIVRAVDPRPGDVLLEIGPGQGAITFPLLQRHGRLTAIEFDRDLLEPLAHAAESQGGDLRLIPRDVLQVDFSELARELGGDGARIRLVGNLPYNLSSPILFHALDHAAAIRDMHFMLQKEVVERMAAGEGSKVYGRLSVMLQAYCQVTPLIKVPPGAFRPAPKVDSAVVRLVPRPRDEITVRDRKRFADIVRAAFGQRRKMLRQSLKPLGGEALLTGVGIDPTRRAETLSIEEFVALANAI